MRFENNEYDIVDEAINDGGVGIFVEKAALERWETVYIKMIKEEHKRGEHERELVAFGKLSVILDLLEHFAEEGA